MPSLTDDQAVVIELSDDQRIASREAVGMFRMGSKIYKIYHNDANAGRLKTQWEHADGEWGLPTPNIRFFHASYRDGVRPLPIDALVLEMKSVNTEKFFQFSHGGEARLRGWIAAEKDKEIIRKIKNALTAAKRCGLMDPQGFYFAGNSTPVLFIDVHTRTVQNDDFNALIALTCGMLA